MSIDEFISALHSASNIEFSVVLRRPEEMELLIKENEALKAQIKVLETRVNNTSGLMAENIGLRSRLKTAKKLLHSHGISCEFCDR